MYTVYELNYCSNMYFFKWMDHGWMYFILNQVESSGEQVFIKLLVVTSSLFAQFVILLLLFDLLECKSFWNAVLLLLEV